MDMDKVVRRKQLLELIGVSAATQYRMERAGLFPVRFRLARGLVGWHLAEVEEWLRSRERVLHQEVQRTSGRRAADRIRLQGGETLVGDTCGFSEAAGRGNASGEG